MNTDDLKYLINRYYDNDLSREEEIELFATLTKDEEGRSYFRKQNLLKLAAIHDIKPFPSELENKILKPKTEKVVQREFKINYTKKFSQLLPYAAAIVLLILALLYSRKSDTYEKQIFNLTREVEDQKVKMEFLYNSLPRVEVTSYIPENNKNRNFTRGKK